MICLTKETMNTTRVGTMRALRLQKGDLVFSKDNGSQSIAWAGKRTLRVEDGSLGTDQQPILLRKNCLGPLVPDRDMLVSPCHRLLLTGKWADQLFGEDEVLVAARHLVGMPGVENWHCAVVTYLHFTCNLPEIVQINGMWSETAAPCVIPTSDAMRDQSDEVDRVFPELKTEANVTSIQTTRTMPMRHEAQLLAVVA